MIHLVVLWIMTTVHHGQQLARMEPLLEVQQYTLKFIHIATRDITTSLTVLVQHPVNLALIRMMQELAGMLGTQQHRPPILAFHLLVATIPVGCQAIGTRTTGIVSQCP